MSEAGMDPGLRRGERRDERQADEAHERDALLLQWAAQDALAARVRTISDFESIPMLVTLDEDRAMRAVSLGAFCLDTKSAAALLREAYLGVVDRLADQMKRLLERHYGVMAAEFVRARKDWAAATARPFGQPLLREDVRADERAASLSADSFADAMGPSPGVRP